MTAAQIRQSFLDFFREKQHTIVPSSSLLPDSPNLLFTNAGMNQFVPIFLGQQSAPWQPPRTADTQKCIRAGGKHNDLDDVGLDTYHHTFFEMLGNWSFGDYFKKEAIEWAWELVVNRWGLPPPRLYATVYQPGDGEPSEFDQEAHDHWARLFTQAGLDPAVQIVNGNKKDNFWMMGDTGPCGPCSELHVDLTPAGDTKGALVNAGDPRCIEIWNLVFIQFNANLDGSFVPLPARHVDTGMGFERACSIIQGTKRFTDFTGNISNYETDVFRPIFDEIERMSGKRYASTLPGADLSSAAAEPGSAATETVEFSTTVSGAATHGGESSTQDGLDAPRPGSSTANAPASPADARATPDSAEQEKIDVAFRVIADHIRTLSFAIADGIQPSNEGRGYVLRRILRRAVRYGRTLGFHEPFFYKLVNVLAATLGDIFPALRAKQQLVHDTVRREEEAFNATLDVGLALFEQACAGVQQSAEVTNPSAVRQVFLPTIRGEDAFKLYDTYGFPLDLTQLLAAERGLQVNVEGFELLMEEQRTRARAAQKKEVISVHHKRTDIETKFVGYDVLTTSAHVFSVLNALDRDGVVVDVSPFYAEMGGQVGDTGFIIDETGNRFPVKGTARSGTATVLFCDPGVPNPGERITLEVDAARRRAIERHHTVTHLLHWALHEVVSREAAQKGSYVGPEKLTFDFNHAALTPEQLRDVEKLVNERIVENAPVSWTEMPYQEVKGRPEIIQVFGDKYGDTVRVVQIGGEARALDGYSMELCGGTHVRGTGEIGLFRIVAESAIAAGMRRVEAVAGWNAYEAAKRDQELIRTLAGKLNSPLGDLEKRIDSMLAQQKALEKSMKALEQKQAAETARELIGRAETIGDVPVIVENLGAATGGQLQAIAEALKQQQFGGVVVLAGVNEGNVALVATVAPQFTAKVQAGKIIQGIAPIVGGKGGGRPDGARGAGKDAAKIGEALAHARALISR